MHHLRLAAFGRMTNAEWPGAPPGEWLGGSGGRMESSVVWPGIKLIHGVRAHKAEPKFLAKTPWRPAWWRWFRSAAASAAVGRKRRASCTYNVPMQCHAHLYR